MAGAFGDLGTLVPFVVGYVTINRLDSQGVLLGFGLMAVATGLYFRTPLSVQPMKAIGTAAIAHAATVTPGMIVASARVTGLFWLAMALTGAVSWLAALTSRPVVRGLVLGLGLSFVLQGATLMQEGPALAIGGAASARTRVWRSASSGAFQWASRCSGWAYSPPSWSCWLDGRMWRVVWSGWASHSSRAARSAT